jgi:hypothetical protein
MHALLSQQHLKDEIQTMSKWYGTALSMRIPNHTQNAQRATPGRHCSSPLANSWLTLAHLDAPHSCYYNADPASYSVCQCSLFGISIDDCYSIQN